jgi:hypothetical protein
MALIFYEGFDTYNSLTELRSARPYVDPGYYVAFSGYPNFQTNEGRFGGKSFGGGYWVYWGLINITSFTTDTELYTGRAVKLPINDEGLICFYGNVGGTNSPDVYVTVSAGVIYAYYVNSGGTNILLGQSSIRFQYNIWHYIEARCKMSTDNTTSDGIVEVWLNNEKIISNTSCVTKKSNTSTTWLGINFSSATVTNGGEWRNDDIYITDTTGPAPWNTRLGDIRIASIVPSADVGANTGTPSTGSTHWGVIDELPYNTSDYLTIPNSSGNAEKFAHAPIPTVPSKIFSISSSMYVLKSDVGSANIRSILVSNTSGYQSNANTTYLNTNYTRYVDVFDKNPETGNTWTSGEFSNTLIGVEVV